MKTVINKIEAKNRRYTNYLSCETRVINNKSLRSTTSDKDTNSRYNQFFSRNPRLTTFNDLQCTD